MGLRKKYAKLEARYWSLDETVEAQRLILIDLHGADVRLTSLQAQLGDIRRIAREVPAPILGETCLYCRHNPVGGLHAPDCPWRGLLKALGVANEAQI